MNSVSAMVMRPEAQKVCNLTGLTEKLHLEGRAVDLEDMIKNLRKSIDESRSEVRWFKRRAYLLTGLRFVKAGCELVLVTAAAIAAAGPAAASAGGAAAATATAQQATAVMMVYENKKLVIDVLNGEFKGRAVGEAATAKAIDQTSVRVPESVKVVLSVTKDILGRLGSALNLAEGLKEDAVNGHDARGASGIEGSLKTLERMAEDLEEKLATLKEALAACKGVPLS